MKWENNIKPIVLHENFRENGELKSVLQYRDLQISDNGS